MMSRLEVHLMMPVDGQKLETFIRRKRLRSQGVQIGQKETQLPFESGKTYNVILVRCPSPIFARDSATELARQFDGILH